MPADLILLHGFTQTGRSWQPVLHALAARYRALAPDLPGHGEFAARRPASFAACDAYLRPLTQAARAGFEAPRQVGPPCRPLCLPSPSPSIS